jgi:serralysin
MTVNSAIAAALRAGAAAGCAAVIGGVVAAGPTYAAAAGVAELTGFNGTSLEYTARAGDDNVIAITMVSTAGGRSYQIDDVVPIAAGNGCYHPDAADLTKVECPGPNVLRVQVNAADGDDVIVNETATISFLMGGPGNDHLTGGDERDSLFGGDGNDHLYGRAETDFLFGEQGSDVIDGGDGDDYLYGDSGDDVLTGGVGRDTLDGGPDGGSPGDKCDGEIVRSCE